MSANVEIKVGSVVKLKSGGPKMTVDRENGDIKVWVSWFDGSELREATVSKASLVLQKDKE